jgi:hypothetical protein
MSMLIVVLKRGQVEAKVQVVSTSYAHVATIVILISTNKVLKDSTDQRAERANACQRWDLHILKSGKICLPLVWRTLRTNHFKEEALSR